MNEPVNKAELEKAGLSPAELLEKFREQLIKDFEMSNALQYLHPLDSAGYEDIHNNVKQALEALSKKGYSNYQQLLYRVDISEKQVNNNKAKTHYPGDLFDNVAELIIKRILQKVILKAIHSR